MVSPTNNVLTTIYQLKLDWGDVTLPYGTTLHHYQIQIATDTAFTAIASDSDVTTSHYIPVTPLGANTKFYWRVRGFNTLGHFSSWSGVRYFRTALLAPVLTTPENNATPIGLRPVFSWQPVAGSTNYTIQVSRYSNFSSLLVSANVSAPTYTSAVNLPRGVILFWRVRTNGTNGPSLWSPYYQFTIQ
jgi:hypothetical protein